MSNQTILNIILSIITVYLAIRNYINTSRKDTELDSQERTEIKVQLLQVKELLNDMQKDIRTSTKDFRELNGRVIVCETRLDEILGRLEKVENHNGKS